MIHFLHLDAAAHLRVFFNTYRVYLTPKEVMDLLLLRYPIITRSILIITSLVTFYLVLIPTTKTFN